MKLIAIIFLVNFTIFADTGKGESKFCQSADIKLDELKEMIGEKDCPSPGDMTCSFQIVWLYIYFFGQFHLFLWLLPLLGGEARYVVDMRE